MKRSASSRLPSLAAAFPATGAHAQTNVQVYGLIDAGVDYIEPRHAVPATAMTRVISGGKNTSRWGFRGSEDIGGGLKAVFNLEGGILMDTGAPTARCSSARPRRPGRRIRPRRAGPFVHHHLRLRDPFDPLGFAPFYSWATSATPPARRSTA
jgi:hypothetical protein